MSESILLSDAYLSVGKDAMPTGVYPRIKFNAGQFTSERTAGEKNARWKGGRFLDKDGYIKVIQKDHPFADMRGYVLEHRLVLEKKLGRFLSKEEVGHHINGNRTDNRPENLELTTRAYHPCIHFKGKKKKN